MCIRGDAGKSSFPKVESSHKKNQVFSHKLKETILCSEEAQFALSGV